MGDRARSRSRSRSSGSGRACGDCLRTRSTVCLPSLPPFKRTYSTSRPPLTSGPPSLARPPPTRLCRYGMKEEEHVLTSTGHGPRPAKDAKLAPVRATQAHSSRRLAVGECTAQVDPSIHPSYRTAGRRSFKLSDNRAEGSWNDERQSRPIHREGKVHDKRCTTFVYVYSAPSLRHIHTTTLVRPRELKDVQEALQVAPPFDRPPIGATRRRLF